VVDIVQAAGRAMRQSEGKEYGYIVLPLLVPSPFDLNAFAESTPFRQMARIITALSTEDERIAEELRLLKTGHKPSDPIIEIEGDVPVGLRVDLNEFAESILARVWERVGRANWRSFEDARSLVHNLGLKSANEWRRFAITQQLPPDIPNQPQQVYSGKGWTNWGDWLGTGQISYRKRQCRSFESAREFVRGLEVKSHLDWLDYCKGDKKPPDIPTAPHYYYRRQGWKSWGDWLGTGRAQGQWRSFSEARSFARELQLNSVADWNAYCKSGKKPTDIPAYPQDIYAQRGWSGYGDWLGTGTIAPRLRVFRPFEEARSFARSLSFQSMSEWNEYAKAGSLPADPKGHMRKTGLVQGIGLERD
jgi:hypothetical protein